MKWWTANNILVQMDDLRSYVTTPPPISSGPLTEIVKACFLYCSFFL
jgi:hypothetical protein